MGYILNTLQFIAAEADFYNLEENRGDSYIPFIGFMMFVIGAVVLFMGFSKYITPER